MSKEYSKEEFFNRYDIDVRDGRLGGGSFGEVYKVYDNERDELKAVKVAPVKYINGKEFNLQSEFDATKDLPVHKNIANYESVHQIEMPNGIFDYAIMQYYPEGNLKALSKNKDLSYADKSNIIIGLIKGLKYIHDNGIIHRDIKPSNILIAERKGVYTPKIADFGLSKIVSAKEMEEFTNSFGGGTLEYSSPEQLLGERLRYNADLWALGIIAYELLTGKIPFAARDVSGSAEAKRKVIYQNIVNAPIPSLVNSCPAPFNEIIKQCLVKDPKKRVKKADALLAMIHSYNAQPAPNSDDDQATIFLDADDGLEDAHTPQSDNSESLVSKYGKWIAGILLALVFLSSAFYFGIFDSKQRETNTEDTTNNQSVESSNEDIKELLQNDPDKQNDISVKEKMKQLRLQQELNIWNLALEDDSVEAYEQYLILYPDGQFVKDAEAEIASKMTTTALDNEESAWQFATQSNSISAYKKIIELYPNGVHTKEAQFKINQLERKVEEQHWLKIKDSNNLEDYIRYKKLFPNGKHLSEANGRAAIIRKDIEISIAYKEAKRINTVEALETFLSKYPQSRYAAELQKRKKELELELSKIKPTPLPPSDIVDNDDDPSNEGFNNNKETPPEQIGEKITTPPLVDVGSDPPKDNPEPKSPISDPEVTPKGIGEEPINKSTKPISVPPFIASIDQNMVELPSIQYNLGCDADCEDDAMPSKKVTINPIKISKYEVTQQEYETIMGTNPSFFSGCADCPVENISFYDAQEYIKKLNQSEGNPYTFRLPTEAEWEYAASAGTSNKYAGGNKIDAVAIYKSNSNRGTSPVNSKKSNKFILFGMSGNVYEWCNTWYTPDGYNGSPDKSKRIIRGGSWSSKSSDCAVKRRGKTNPDDKRPYIGMRLVRDL